MWWYILYLQCREKPHGDVDARKQQDKELKGQLGVSTETNLGTPAWSVKTDWWRLTIRH